MIRKLACAFTLIAVCLTAFIWYGCSDNTVRTVISADEWAADSGDSYFLPLDRGFAVVYEITKADGSSDMITLEVGKMVPLGSIMAYEWFSDDGSIRDTGYIAAGVDAAYFYESASSSAEKMLQLPLVVGDSWERFSEDYDGDDWVDILTDDTDDDDDSETQDDAFSKVLPSEGGNIMTVVGYEDVELSYGSYFTNAVKIRNDGDSPGKMNYYWYVSSIGLVKYVLGTTDGSYPRGDVVGELVDYGH